MSALPAAAASSASSDPCGDAIATSGRSDTLDDISIEMSTSVYDQSMRMPPPERTREDARPRVAMPEPLMASGVSAFFTYLFEHPAKALEDFRRLDCSRDGALEPKEFARWLAIYSVSEEAAHALFEYIDFDHNGAIQLEELLVVAQQVQPSAIPSNIVSSHSSHLSASQLISAARPRASGAAAQAPRRASRHTTQFRLHQRVALVACHLALAGRVWLRLRVAMPAR
jgi:hypothetical protein